MSWFFFFFFFWWTLSLIISRWRCRMYSSQLDFFALKLKTSTSSIFPDRRSERKKCSISGGKGGELIQFKFDQGDWRCNAFELPTLSMIRRAWCDISGRLSYVCHFSSRQLKNSNIPLIQVHLNILIIKFKTGYMIVTIPVGKSISSFITFKLINDVRLMGYTGAMLILSSGTNI